MRAREGLAALRKYRSETLAQHAQPTGIVFLQPITILPTGAKIEFRVMLNLLQPHDTAAYECMLGFKKTYECADVLQTIRCEVERCTEFSTPMCVAQLDFAREYDSARYTPLAKSMQKHSRSRWL